MQPRVTQVGPLAAANATNIAVSQTLAAAGAVALTGTTTQNTVAGNICAVQSGTAATPLLLNSTLCRAQYSAPTMNLSPANVAYIPNPNSIVNASSTTSIWSPNQGQPICIRSVGNDSGITFTVVGIRAGRVFQGGTYTEVVQGSNAGLASTQYDYEVIISITPSGNTASTVRVGTCGLALLDTARRVLITSGGTDTGITFTITGLDWAGNDISEVLTGGSSGNPVYSVLDYLAVTKVVASGATASTVTVGTNGVASSPWINFDTFAMGTTAFQAVVSGTANYTVQTSNDDPNSYGNPIARAAVTWDSNYAGLTSQTVSASYGMAQTPVWARVLMNSNTNPAYVRLTATQHLSATT